MTPPLSAWCNVFVVPDVPVPGRFKVQWQFPTFMFTCTARDLGFAQVFLDFVVETRGNPGCRDAPMGGGVYRYMAEKSVDLSPYFDHVTLRLQKLGKSDDGYMMSLKHAGASLQFDIDGDITEALLQEIREIAEGAR